ncbi:hypothetical protein IE53DRAFT_174364 [Violaceomyces palustris]|uniref:Uncharacterized protein n=1 Tax=Violaceomyces palustris TaxID=1673888 RepID=A0ACD0P5S2_9BASI|nr:hypothetical protein IE53DRAFT_174364 [Violaceomyces palustris]
MTSKMRPSSLSHNNRRKKKTFLPLPPRPLKRKIKSKISTSLASTLVCSGKRRRFERGDVFLSPPPPPPPPSLSFLLNKPCAHHPSPIFHNEFDLGATLKMVFFFSLYLFPFFFHSLPPSQTLPPTHLILPPNFSSVLLTPSALTFTKRNESI